MHTPQGANDKGANDIRLYRHDAFLDDATCTELIRNAHRAQALPAKVIKGARTETDEAVRRTKTVRLEAAFLRHLEQLYTSILPLLEAYFEISLHAFEPPQLLRYGRGDFFVAHQDSGHGPEHPDLIQRRAVSTVLFLNDQSLSAGPHVFGGGTLTLLDPRQAVRMPVRPQTGQLVAFPSHTFHQVTPVQHGERFTIVTWYNSSETTRKA